MTNNNNSNSGSTGGITFIGALQLTFIILKLIKVIKWSWWWVLSPTWISAILAFILIFIVIRIMKR